MASVTSGWLVYQPENNHLIPHVQDCAQHQDAILEPIELNRFIENAPAYLAENSHVIALLESVDLGLFLQTMSAYAGRVGLLPVHPKSKVCRLYKIPSSMEDAMPLALASDRAVKMDLLLCNNEVVTWMVTLGDVPFVEIRQIVYQEGLLWQHVKSIPAGIRALFRLQPKMVFVSTAKDTKFKTAIVGALVIQNDIESVVPHFANEKVSNLDGKISTVLVAPSSIMDYLGFFVAALSPKPQVSPAISYFKTARFTLESPKELSYYIDGQSRSAKTIAFRVMPKAVAVNVGQKFLSEHPLAENDKDVVKIKTLPQGEERLTRLKQHLPLFSIAREDDFKDLFVMLRDYARPTANFLFLMILSAMLATLGLFLNSAPVVIGAMLIAPLMGPLVALAMGVLRNDAKLMKDALQVFLIGTGFTLLVATITTVLLPYEQATDEVRARLQPNLLDLGVAVVSGIAAAYAHAKENLQKNLVGVAIAVALVPPACVIGIGVGWLDWGTITGAGLLFLTNLVGIVLAGMLTFLCLGFAPVITVSRSLGLSLLLTALISVPLYHTFKNTVLYQRVEKSLSTRTYQVNGKTVTLSDVLIIPEDEKIKIMAQLHSTEAIETSDIAELRDVIGAQMEEPVTLDVSLRVLQ
ncbi:TIGR00341 family protein [Methylomonas sp. MgM2]